MKIDKRIVPALRECSTAADVEETFRIFGITETKDKQHYVILAMCSPVLFFERTEDATEEDIYKTVLFFFEQKEWRYGLALRKLGLPPPSPLAPETQKIFDKLKKCTTQEEIDSILQNEGITETAGKCRILRQCMGFSEYLGEAGKTPDNDDYEFDCAVFLSDYADIRTPEYL